MVLLTFHMSDVSPVLPSSIPLLLSRESAARNLATPHAATAGPRATKRPAKCTDGTPRPRTRHGAAEPERGTAASAVHRA